MPRARKHPDAIPFEVARDWLEEAAAFLDSEVGRGLPNGDGLDPDARAFTIRFLRAAAAGKPLAFQRGIPDQGRAQEAASHVQEALLSGEADTLTAAYKIAAQRMKTSIREIERYCSKVWGRVRPVPLSELRDWLHQDS